MQPYIFFRYRFSNLAVLLLLIVTAMPITAVQGAPMKKILVLPFNLNSTEKKNHLQQAIADMLTARLSIVDRSLAIQYEAGEKSGGTLPDRINQVKALELARQVQADHVAFGSINDINGQISFNAFFMTVASKKIVLVFNKIGSGQSKLISHVDAFAEKIIQTVLLPESVPGGLPTTPRTPKAPAVGLAVQKPAAPVSSSSDNRAEFSVPKTRQQSTPTAGSETVASWQSDPIYAKIIGVAVGDIDGDQKAEIVCLTEDKLVFFHRTGNGLEPFKEFKNPTKTNMLRIELLDLNQNGRDDLFITAKNYGFNKIVSFVVEWNGRQFVKIQEGMAWALWLNPSIGEHGQGRLYGQKLNYNDAFQEKNDVFEIDWQNGAYRPVPERKLPFLANILGFSPLSFNGITGVVKFKPTNFLVVEDDNGRVLWESDDGLGGTELFVEKSIAANNASSLNRQYLYQRILPVDWNGDSHPDIVVANNEESSNTRALANLRSFKSGRMVCLTWENKKFRTIWKSESLYGYISDYALGDLDNDQKMDLVAVNVVKPKGVFAKSRSYLVSWALPNM